MTKLLALGILFLTAVRVVVAVVVAVVAAVVVVVVVVVAKLVIRYFGFNLIYFTLRRVAFAKLVILVIIHFFSFIYVSIQSSISS